MKIFNSLTNTKEEFKPIEPGKVKIYACGPTVYNYFHIGNARPFVVFDTLRKFLIYRGLDVCFVQNFTDVDDKIIKRANEEGVPALTLSENYIKEYFDDALALHIKEADVHPKVSEHIPDIIKFIETLIDKGFAYEIDGDVYFSPRKFPDYGKLSGQNIDDLESGARIAIGEKKHDPLDFALWKARKEESEIAWDSPWGMGRPGWHIECSTMAKKHLGDTIDIHGGGLDLKFPHHENEIAQSESCNGCTFANYWMHNGYITVDGEKMSKSLGNFFTVRDIRKEFSGEVIRFFLLSVHYRSPINFSDASMLQAKQGLDRILTALETLEFLTANGQEGDNSGIEKLTKYREQFIEAMEDDLNTALAISAIFDMVSEINLMIKDGATKSFAKEAIALIRELGDILGILPDQASDEIPAELRQMLDEREAARKARDFALADKLRDEIESQGFIIKDTKEGAQLIKK